MCANRLPIIRRTDKGLTISGTRVTLYALLDYLHAGWTDGELLDMLNLTDDQLSSALDYIAVHHDEIEAEYQVVLYQATERRRYWEQRLQEHLAQTAPAPFSPEKATLYARLAEQRGQLIQEMLQEEATDPTGATKA